MKKMMMVLALVSLANVATATTYFTTDFGEGYDVYLDTSGGTAAEGSYTTPYNSFTVVAKTKDTDFLTGDWEASVGFDTYGNREYMFLTVGLGDPSASWTPGPTSAPCLYMRAGKWYANQDAAVISYDGTTETTLESFAGYSSYGGYIYITKIGDEITFKQTRTGGTYESATYNISTVAPFLNSTNAKFFVSTGDPDVWPAIIDIHPIVTLLEGDADRDGVVSAGDYASIQSNFGNSGDPGIPGDANGDGVVSALDYASVKENFGSTLPASSVPEPVTLSLLAFGGVALLRRK